jgi:hypothetical protein
VPLAPPVDAPYAYVVDYRPLDACAPPACRLAGQKLLGWWDQVQNDGGRGAYARIGEPESELYFRRSEVLRSGKSFEFELVPEPGQFEYDGYFASATSDSWKAELEVALPDGRVLWQQGFEGHTKQVIDTRLSSDMARYEDYFQHVRFSLPARDEPLRVSIRNRGEGALSIGSPLVLRKEPGRRPRQAIFVVWDAVPEPLMTRMLTGSGDRDTAWLGEAVRQQGTLFARGTSPGFNSPTFIRRFFRAGFYETQGEPSLFGQGIDEQSPASPPSPVTRLLERGFQVEFSMANFMLLPTQTRLGFDGGYQNDRKQPDQVHPAALVRRFRSWLHEHPHDDALHVIWFSSTHWPYPPGRAAPPFELNTPGLRYSQGLLDAIWRNLLELVDRLAELRQAAQAEPPADRIWLLVTDHGRIFTQHSLEQPWWLESGKQVFDGNSWHCCLASFEESQTPFAVLYEGSARVTPPRVDEPTSSVAVWRLLERSFGVELELPNTSTFHTPGVEAPAPESRWQEGFLASAGDSGSIRAVADRWAYRSLRIQPRLVPLFTWSDRTQRGLTGSPNRGDYFLAEELYDRSVDPYELHNLADAEERTVLEFRRKLTDWLAVYYDPPSHPRYEYTLEFPHALDLTLSAPERLSVSVDGSGAPSAPANRVSLRGRRFVLHADAEPLAIVDLEGSELAGLVGETPSPRRLLPNTEAPDVEEAAHEVLVRCAATGLPLQVLEGDRARLNLALARTNCVGSDAEVALGPSDVSFRARLVQESRVSSGGGMTEELLDGLRSWGYVRDLDQAQGSRPP